MKNICVIAARGGSKRVPNKNIISFHGKPLLAHTIIAAARSGLFGKNIYVSSDSRRILAVAKKYGARTVKRPRNISGDGASLEQAAFHFLGSVDEKFDNLCLLMPSSPLRNDVDLKKSYGIFKKTKAKSLMSVATFHWFYPFWALQEKNGYLEFFFGRKYLRDSKLLPKNIYCPTGGIRWVKIASFLKAKKFYSKYVVKYIIPFERAVDIDTHEDLELARMLYKLK